MGGEYLGVVGLERSLQFGAGVDGTVDQRSVDPIDDRFHIGAGKGLVHLERVCNSKDLGAVGHEEITGRLVDVVETRFDALAETTWAGIATSPTARQDRTRVEVPERSGGG